MPVLVLLLALIALAAPATAAAAPVVGIGEQKATMFTHPEWQKLGLRHARYVAPWDALRDPAQRKLLDDWMAAARRARVRVLLGFAHSLRSEKLARALPTPRQFGRQFRRFRARYPRVRDWIVWNEANHPFSLTARRPRRAAQFFDAAARECPSCRIVAADILDMSGMTDWIRAFKRHVRHRPRIWGLHNYVDVNSLQRDGTDTLLRLTRGPIWITETGGVITRREYAGKRVLRTYTYSQRHAARVTRFTLRLLCTDPRIRRLYLYHWQAPMPVTNWDSAFLSAAGRTRPAYDVLLRWTDSPPRRRCR